MFQIVVPENQMYDSNSSDSQDTTNPEKQDDPSVIAVDAIHKFDFGG